ncbi:MAG: hypothetical protein IPQ03_00975 [Bacteroidetes bacterium]|nr:hypothetical protein [Bacteroidota bacterium]
MKIIKNRFLYGLLSLLPSWFCILSCNVINPGEPVPAYFHLDSMNLNTDYLTQGSSSSKIVDVWVSIDNKYLGTYGLPVTFPALAEGNYKISFRAGVQVNGMTDNRAAYPPFATFDTTLNTIPGSTLVLNPTVSYKSGTVFKQIEDFDDGSLSLVSTSSNLAILNITPTSDPNAFETNSGFVVLDDNHAVFEVASADTFSLPISVPVYLELNYKADCEFTVGVFISGASVLQSPLLNIRPSSTWKKIYVNISELGGVTSGNVFYKIYLKSTKSSSVSTATLYFDNLKVLY